MSMKFTSKNTLTRIFERLNLIFVRKSDVVNNLTSEDTDKLLSAKQGNILNDKINTLSTKKFFKYRDVSISIGNLNSQEELYNKTTDFQPTDGYTPVAITGFQLEGTGYTYCLVSRVYVSGQTIHWSIKNMHSTNSASNLILTVFVTECLTDHS